MNLIRTASIRLRLGCIALFAGALSMASLSSEPKTIHDMTDSSTNDSAVILGGGCFWCVEAVYETLDGIIKAESGYAGGHVKNPTYKQVVTGETGHAEVVKLTYDPAKISLDEIFDFFWIAHDPTTLNRQGADRGTQYRSIILYTNEEQKARAEASIKKAQQDFSDPIVTQLRPLDAFYRAEDYHQDYYDNNKNQPYCRYVIKPKLQKLEKVSQQ